MKKLLFIIPLLLFPLQVFGVIAYESAWGNNSGSGTSVSLASVHPVGSSDMLVCSIMAATAGTTVSAGPSFGGSSFTQEGSYIDTADGNRSLSIWYLRNPSTSSGSVTATLSVSDSWWIGCDSYTGVLQTGATWGTPQIGTGALGTPLDISLTSTSTGSWMFLSAKEDSGSTALSISAGGIQRQAYQVLSGPTRVVAAQYDSNAGINNGVSNKMTINWTGGAQRIGYLASYFSAAPEIISPPSQDAIISSDDQ